VLSEFRLLAGALDALHFKNHTMYQYTDFDRQFVHQRAAQFRDQLERWQKGKLAEDEFRPLRLQNGWYVQRYAPMLRVAVPYGELSSRQLRVLARIAREYDEPEAEVYRKAIETQGLLGQPQAAHALRPLHDAPERPVQLDSAGQVAPT
jgi:sulfite reductase beta subunit-like hemoprotein